MAAVCCIHGLFCLGTLQEEGKKKMYLLKTEIFVCTSLAPFFVEMYPGTE